VILALALLPPLLAVALLAAPGMQRRVLTATPWLPLAALPAALAPPPPMELEFLLLGLRLGLEPWAQPLLAATALLWACAGWALRHGGPVSVPRLLAWQLTLAGNLGALMALDEPGFYLFFALLSIAAYGVVVRNRAARGAARTYLAVALFAELLLLAGLMLLALGRPGPTAGVLLLFGLGAKLGMLPLHFPLPPAYAATDAAGAAVFGGGLTMAAVAGWLRFVPQVGTQPELAIYALAAGLAAAFLGAAAGLLQRDSRALLAYSTISQMGIVTAGLGLALAGPAPLVAAPLALFALHHGLTKAALLLGTGAGGPLVLTGLALLSLALAGAPLSGGALAKAWLESMGEGAPALAEMAHGWLPFTSAATALLMARFLWLMRGAATRSGQRGPFAALTVTALAAPWLALLYLHPQPTELVKGWATLWPLLVAAGVLALAWPLRTRIGRWRLPPGDLVVVAAPLGRLLYRAAAAWGSGRPPRLLQLSRFAPRALERHLRGLPGTGVVLFALVLLFAVVLALG